jgi:hypothetical protein
VTFLETCNRLTLQVFFHLEMFWVNFIHFSLRASLMILKDRINFELSPWKIAIIKLVNDCPPKSSFKNAANKIWVISWTNISTINHLIIGGFYVETVRIVDLPQKVVVKKQFISIFFRILLFLPHSEDKWLLFYRTSSHRDILFNLKYLRIIYRILARNSF